MKPPVHIGDRVTDTINHFSGLVTGRTEYLNGCRQFLVKPEKLDKNGKVNDGMWIDEQNLKVVDSQVLPDPFLVPGAAAVAGGPDRREPAR